MYIYIHIYKYTYIYTKILIQLFHEVALSISRDIQKSLLGGINDDL
jgi:hypothetical protein